MNPIVQYSVACLTISLPSYPHNINIFYRINLHNVQAKSALHKSTWCSLPTILLAVKMRFVLSLATTKKCLVSYPVEFYRFSINISLHTNSHSSAMRLQSSIYTPAISDSTKLSFITPERPTEFPFALSFLFSSLLFSSAQRHFVYRFIVLYRIHSKFCTDCRIIYTAKLFASVTI